MMLPSSIQSRSPGAGESRRTTAMAKIKWMRDLANPLLVPVCAAIFVALRSICYGLRPEGNPLGFIFKWNRKKQGKLTFITNNVTYNHLKACARIVYPDITKTELSQFSAHMFRVTACVLLQHAGKDADYIKTRLRWESEAYRTYLRNTDILANQHITAVVNGVSTTCKVYATQPANVPEIAATHVDIDGTSGPYLAFAS